jgi:hypothetical protein
MEHPKEFIEDDRGTGARPRLTMRDSHHAVWKLTAKRVLCILFPTATFHSMQICSKLTSSLSSQQLALFGARLDEPEGERQLTWANQPNHLVSILGHHVVKKPLIGYSLIKIDRLFGFFLGSSGLSL